MAHRSRLSALVIDCRTDDLAEAAAFWSDALGAPARIDARGRYAVLDRSHPHVLLQAVQHAPRVHLDLETDDQEAEVARLTALGAREVARVRHWIVMEAPTGHRFCIDPPTPDFPGDAKEHP
jgi:hypothetical protein